MPIRLPVALAVLAACLTVGLVAIAVSAGGPPPAERPHAVARHPAGPAVAARVAALEVLHDWDQSRSAAWAAGDTVALARFYTPRSSAGRADVALLRRYRLRGYAVRDLRMQVLRARVIVATTRLLRIDVTDRLARAVAVPIGRADQARRLPADEASGRVLVLERRHGRWLMSAVLPSVGR